MTRLPSFKALLSVGVAGLTLAACAVGPKAPDAVIPPAASGAFNSAPGSTAVTAAEARDD